MRRSGSSIITVIVVVWLLIGVLAAFQRGYFGNAKSVSCKKTADIVVTIVAGPLNYFGVNPKVNCKLPKPSK
jgi:hypothetical protein